MIQELLKNGYFALFLIITIGILIGRIKVKGISLDLSAVIFVALFFGHFGVTIPAIFQKIGLLLFIYSIGIQAGPGFFASFRKGGFRIIMVSTVLVITGALITMLSIFLFDVDKNIAVGLFAGALTSTPGLAAAIESTQSQVASIGYGVAYPFGVIGVIIFVHLIPRIFSINIQKSEIDYENTIKEEYPEIMHKHFSVENINIIGKTIDELKIRTMTEATISRVLHKGKTSIPSPNTRLYHGDIIRAVGTQEALDKVELLVGKIVTTPIPLNRRSEVKWIIVTNKKVVSKTLGQLNLFENYEATITRIRRSGIDITPEPSSSLRFGDKLLVACRGNMQALGRFLGNETKKLTETDFLPIAAGIMLGVLLGNIEIPLFGTMTFKPGLTGGVLLTALILSRIGKTGFIIWNVSGPANQLLRQLGLLLFLTAVGTNAGANLIQTISENGIRLFMVGIAITLIPMLIATWVGYFLFRVNFLTLLGTLTGGMTSTPGLSAVGAISESAASSIAYATVYPIAMVILIICTQLLAFL